MNTVRSLFLIPFTVLGGTLGIAGGWRNTEKGVTRAESRLKDEEFLRKFIKKAIPKERNETSLWDFKKTIPAWHKSKPKLKKNFARDIAAFANNEGGMLLIGITDDRKIVGVENSEEKIKQTRTIIEKYIDNLTEEVEILSLPVENKDSEPVTCLVIPIPQSAEPIRVINPNKKAIIYPKRKDVEIKNSDISDLKEDKSSVMTDNYKFARKIHDFLHPHHLLIWLCLFLRT